MTRPRRAREAPASETLTWSSRFVEGTRAKVEAHHEGPVAAWRIHDLRHTIATHLRERFKVESEVVLMILGHTPPGVRVSRIYNRAELLPERRAALVAWGAWLLSCMQRRGPGARRRGTGGP